MAEITDPGLLSQLNSSAAPKSGLVTDPDLLAKLNATQENPSVSGDIAKSAGIGLAKGLLDAGGFVGDVTDLGAKGIKAASDYISNKLGMEPYQRPKDSPTLDAIKTAVQAIPTEKSLQDAVESQTGKFYEPKTTYGKFAQTASEFAGNPLSYVGPGGMLAKGATAAAAGLGSEAGGELADKYAPNSPKLKAMLQFLGGTGGGLALAGAPRIVSPNIIDPERQAMIDTLRNEGVTSLSAGQQIGSRPLKWTESVLADQPFVGRSPEQINEEAAGQFTRAALRRVGENSPRATSEVIDRAFNRIGNLFDTLAANNDMILDPQVQNDLLNTTIQYHDAVNPMMRSPIVENVMNDAATWAGQQGGQLTGRQYQNLRSRLSSMSRSSGDPQLSHALQDMAESLDDAMERSIAARNPQDAGQFADARRQWRNMMVIEKAATSGGAENVGRGIITPAALQTATKSALGTRSFARGQNEFADLAKAGTGIMMPLPQSGTAPRENVLHNLQLAGLLAAEPAAWMSGAELPHMAMGAAAGIAGPALAGRALMSRPVQRYLANQRLPYQVGTSPTMEALVNEIGGGNTAPAPNARKAKDGKWYVPDKSRPGKYLMVNP